MEYVILGFLMIRTLSQYDLLKALSKEVSPFYQPSLGSIQNGLKKLLVKGYISKKIVFDSERKKYNYKITKLGKEYLKEWMLGDYKSSKFDMDFNTKLFFLGHLNIQERILVIRKTKLFVETTLESFYKEEISIQQTMNSETISDIVIYQIKTLEIGIHSHKSILDWISKELTTLEESQ